MLLMEAFKYFLTTINFRKIKVLFLYKKENHLYTEHVASIGMNQ